MVWKKGESGLPGGNRSSKNRIKPFRDALEMEIKAAGDGSKKLRQIANKLLELACEGNMQAIQTLFERLDGKVPQPVEGEVTHEIRAIRWMTEAEWLASATVQDDFSNHSTNAQSGGPLLLPSADAEKP